MTNDLASLAQIIQINERNILALVYECMCKYTIYVCETARDKNGQT